MHHSLVLSCQAKIRSEPTDPGPPESKHYIATDSNGICVSVIPTNAHSHDDA